MVLVAVENGWYDTGDGKVKMVLIGDVTAPGSAADEQCPTVFEVV